MGASKRPLFAYMGRYKQDELPPFMRGRERTVIGTEHPE